MQLDNNQQAFFELVKAGLWESEVRLSSIGDIDYDEIFRIADEQTVTGLVTAGAEHVDDVKIPQEIMLQFIGDALQIEQRNKAMNEFVESIIQMLRDRNVNALLMKGQGIAQCYNRPNWRTCGDVDLLLSNEDYEKAKNILIPLASSIDAEQGKRKHLALTILETFGTSDQGRADNWVVELHGTLRTNLWKSLERTMDDVQGDIFYNGHVRSWMNGRTQVFLPRADEDVVFVFAHILQHFFIEGIGLRQICDWCRLLYTYKDEIDRKLLERRLRSARMIGKWKVFASFAVEYLGMPADAMPFYSNSWCLKRKANRVMTLVMDAGNFGQGKDNSYKERHSKGIRYCISFGRHAKDGFRRFCIFPAEALLMWWKLMLQGLKRVLGYTKVKHRIL